MIVALPPELVDQIVLTTFSSYAALSFRPQPTKFTILASFILVHHTGPPDTARIQVISLGAGSKCLPEDKLPASGDALHDSHAEVLARRGAVRWLVQEILRDCDVDEQAPDASRDESMSHSRSPWITRESSGSGKYHLRDGIKLVLYVSTVPCGDASTRLLASLQDPTMASLKDATSWPTLPSEVPSRGRDDYSRLGVLRTKPGRADAPPVLSMTCSDKIARWSVLGIQGALMSKLFEPVYIDEIIIGEVGEEMRCVVREDCMRAFYGRLCELDGLPPEYRISHPEIYFTNRPFIHSRPCIPGASTSSNDALCHIHGDPQSPEVLINGLRRGVAPKHRSNQKFWPLTSKISLLNLHLLTLKTLNLPTPSPSDTYHTIKRDADEAYQLARRALLDPGAPFAGWIVSGARFESFDAMGQISEPVNPKS